MSIFRKEKSTCLKTCREKGWILSLKTLSTIYIDLKKGSFSFYLSTSPFSHESQIYGLTNDFTSLIIETKHVCHRLIIPHVNFRMKDNASKYYTSKNLYVRGGGGSGERKCLR